MTGGFKPSVSDAMVRALRELGGAYSFTTRRALVRRGLAAEGPVKGLLCATEKGLEALGLLGEDEPTMIVLAWTVTEHVHDGRPFRADLGHQPGMVARTEAKAVTWLLAGTTRDYDKARVYLAQQQAEAQLRAVYRLTLPQPPSDSILRDARERLLASLPRS